MNVRNKVAVTCFALFVVAFGVARAASLNAGQVRVLQGIPAIAKAFAPVAGVKWEEFANVLAGICAVESTCSPTYPHRTSGGAWSQYQGLVQMNMAEVAKAEMALQRMLPAMEAAAASDPDKQKALEFVKKAIQSARSMGGDRRFHPEYGMILGAAKHIQINAQLARQYPGDPVRQACGHMTAQFSGVTEGKIRGGQFGAAITGDPWGNPASSEAAALRVNKVVGAATVSGAVEASCRAWGSKMQAMMQNLSQATNGLTTVPDNVAPFAGPEYNPGVGPQLGVGHSAVSTLMEEGYAAPYPAPAYPQTAPPPVSLAPATTPTTQSTTGAQTGQTSMGVPQSSDASSTSSSIVSNLLNALRGDDAGVPSGPPVAFMYIQPRTVSTGGKVLISWTSVNMGSSCTVTHKSGVIGKGAEGSQLIKASDFGEGEVRLELRCVTPEGVIYAQEDAILIE